MEVRPFPLAILPRVTRREQLLVRRLRRHLGADVARSLARWAGAWLGLPVEEAPSLRIGRISTCELDDALRERLARAPRWLLRGTHEQSAMIALDRPLAQQITALLLRASRPPPVHDTVLEGIVSFGLNGLLVELQPQCWTLCQPPAPLPVAGEEPIVFEVRITLQRRRFVAWLLIGQPVLAALDEAEPAWRPQRLEGLAWPASAEIGRVELDAAELASLQVGDTVVWPECPAAIPRAVRLAVAGGSFGADLLGDRLTISEPFRLGTGATTMSAEGDSTMVGELEVELVLELGRIRMTAAELMQLGVGDTVTVGRPVGGKLDLRVGGRLIASGELVDVEGEAGVRITDLYD